MPITGSKEDPLQFWGWRANKCLTAFKDTVAHCFSNQPWSLEGLFSWIQASALSILLPSRLYSGSILRSHPFWWRPSSVCECFFFFFFLHFGRIWNQMVSNRMSWSSGTGSISLELCWFILQPILLEHKLSYGNRAEKSLAWLLWDQAAPLELAGMQAI